MKRVHVAAAALNQTPLDWEGNTRRIREILDEARAAGVGLLCLPELCLTGYGCEDAFLSPAVQETALQVLAELLPDTRGLVVSLGLPLFVGGAVFNVVCLVSDGRILGFVPKQKLAGDGIHYEPRWFKPWPAGVVSTVRVLSAEVPIGDLVFELDGVIVGFEICEDAWVAERPGASLAVRGVDIILNPSASHFAFGKHEVRQRLVLEGARAFGVSYVYANLLGNEAGRAIYDGDLMIASAGGVLAQGPRFSFAEHQLVRAVVDVDLTRTRRAWLSSYRPSVAPDPGRVRVERPLPEAPLELPGPALLGFERSPHTKEEEFARAVALGLFDYMRKSRSRGFVVSLSGGADSAACACLVALMVGFGCAELGLDGFVSRLDYMRELSGASDPRALVERLLTTVYQATRNSGDVTLTAARAVAEAVGAVFAVIDIDELVAAYESRCEQVIGRPLSWAQDDIARQNIQARVRSPSVWMIANVRGALLLSTSNRSEAAVGYATMDGDTSGGLSPIAGIDKNFLRRWLRWLEEQGPVGLAPIPALGAVNRQAPTAELRPAASKQTDEDDLMPYDLLDAVERAAIRDKRGPVEVWEIMRARFPQHTPAQLGLWVERFFVLWSRNQWKRERYAPSFHLDDANLDPRTWCRWPILSGGFARELAALRARVAGLAEERSA